MSTTLEDLRADWAAYHRAIDARLRLDARIAREGWIEAQRERVRRRPSFGPFSMAVWIVTVAALGMFIAANATHPGFLIPALMLQAWTLATGAVAIHQQQALRGLDYTLPLVELQARIEALRIARIRAFNVAFLTGQVVWWIPFAIVLVRGALHVDLYAVPGFTFFALVNLAVGIAAIPLAIAAARRYGERLGRASWMRRLADSIAGSDIAAAREYLAKLRRFEEGA
jgi:hypothetical protein